MFAWVKNMLLLVTCAFSTLLLAQSPALELAEKIANRATNDGLVGYMHFTLRNDSGGERKRSALLIHSQLGNDSKIGIFFTAPAALQNTGFLSHDYVTANDENWLYLPATDRVRKLPASSSADYFMGTDLSYGDIKNSFKFGLDDWDFMLEEPKVVEQKSYFALNGVAKNAQKIIELGYARFSALIDPETFIPVQIQYWDKDNTPFKQLTISRQEKIGKTWTATQFTVVNLQQSHQTEIILSDMRNVANLPLGLLSPDELGFGVPNIQSSEGGQ